MAEQATSTNESGAVKTDGRRLRRERGRAAVIDATIELVFEGHLPPSAEAIAERAGVSVASLFRYFETLDDLRRTTSEAFLERTAHLHEIPDLGEGPLGNRIDGFVAARLALYETNGQMARMLRRQAHEEPTAGQTLEIARGARTDEVRRHFAPELEQLGDDERDDLLGVVVMLTSFESWELARHSLGRSTDEVARMWRTAIRTFVTEDRN